MWRVKNEYIDGAKCTMLLKEKNWKFEWWQWDFLLFKWDDKIKLVEEMSKRCKEHWWNLNLIFKEKKKKKDD